MTAEDDFRRIFSGVIQKNIVKIDKNREKILSVLHENVMRTKKWLHSSVKCAMM